MQPRNTPTAVWRGSQTFFPFLFSLFLSVGIIITVSRTPFKLMPGELFSPGLFTAIIKCLWIVQRPIFKSLSLPFEGSGKSIKLQKLSYFSSGEEKQSRELLALKCCRRFPMNEKLPGIIMSREMDFETASTPSQALWQQCWAFGGERWAFSGCCCSHIHPGMRAGREGWRKARAGPQSIQNLL